MRKRQPPDPSARRRAAASVCASLAFLVLGGGPLPAQEIELVAPAAAEGPGVDLWIESSYPDLDFGYWLSEPAYVAVFEVVPGLGATLVVPDRERSRDRVLAGHRVATGAHYRTLYRNDVAFARALGARHLSARYGYGLYEPVRGYLLLVASRTPLELWRFGRLDDYRYTSAGLAGRSTFDGGARRALERLVDLVVPDLAGGWTAASASYSLLPHADRFASRHATSLCGYGFGFPGHGGYGFLPIGSYRHGGYGLGHGTRHFPGLRSFRHDPFARGIGLWSHPFGFGLSSGFGLGGACGFGAFPFHPFGHPLFFPQFPGRTGGRGSPPSDEGRRAGAIPPAPIHPRSPIPLLERPVTGEAVAPAGVQGLLRSPVALPRLTGELERGGRRRTGAESGAGEAASPPRVRVHELEAFRLRPDPTPAVPILEPEARRVPPAAVAPPSRSGPRQIRPPAGPATRSGLRAPTGLPRPTAAPPPTRSRPPARARPASVRPTSVRPASVRPASARPTSVRHPTRARPTSLRPTSLRPALRESPRASRVQATAPARRPTAVQRPATARRPSARPTRPSAPKKPRNNG